MEVLSDILRSMRVSGSVYFCDGVVSPWTKRFNDANWANFHMVRRGQCWLSTHDTTQRLGPGDFVFVEPGREHVLSSEHPDETTRSVPAETLLLCGYCRFDAELDHPLLSALPALTIVRAEELHRHPWIASTLDQLSAEFMSQMPGAEVVVDKLTEILLVGLIRVDFGRRDRDGFIGALYDKTVSRALALLHADPQAPWTLERVARSVGLSRAALAKRFRERVGQTMNDYLTRLRMRKARELLRGSELPLNAIANRVGYDSDVAFAKAFKRVLGLTPARYRIAARSVGVRS